MKKIIVMTLCLFTTSIKPASCLQQILCPNIGGTIAQFLIEQFNPDNRIHKAGVKCGTCCATALLATGDLAMIAECSTCIMLNPAAHHCFTIDACDTPALIFYPVAVMYPLTIGLCTNSIARRME